MFRIILFIAALTLTISAALNVPLDVVNWADVARTGEPVTAGICLPSGQVYDLSKLRITDGSGATVPAQFKWMSK